MTRTCWPNCFEKICEKSKKKLPKSPQNVSRILRNCAARWHHSYVKWSGSKISGKLSWVFSSSGFFRVCRWILTNLPDSPPTFGETESQFAWSELNPFLPVRLLTSMRDSNVKWSGTVILCELRWIISSSGLIRVCCWSSIDLLNFPTPLVLKRNVAVA